MLKPSEQLPDFEAFRLSWQDPDLSVAQVAARFEQGPDWARRVAQYWGLERAPKSTPHYSPDKITGGCTRCEHLQRCVEERLDLTGLPCEVEIVDELR